MRKIISSVLAVSILLTILTPIPLTSAISKISVFAEKPTYVAGESVYIFGTIGEPIVDLSQVEITVIKPSGSNWASVSVLPDSDGNFGATVGSISQLDSTGTYLVSVTYRALSNSTTFQVKTQQTITVETDSIVYLVNETITVSGRVSPLLEGYRVTLRIGPNDTCGTECMVAVDQTTPMPDGSYIFQDFYTVRSIDNGHWVVNATYGPLGFAAAHIYVGVRVILTPSASEYLPGDLVNITGNISPVISGPVQVMIKNPSGGIWVDLEATPNGVGDFNFTEIVYPGDQVGNYSVSGSYWGVTNYTSFMLGKLGTSVVRIAALGVYNFTDGGMAWLYQGSMVRVRAALVNTDIVTHDLLFIIQIKDSSGKLVFIACQSSSVKPGDFVGQTAGQPFWDEGTYTVEVFVWDSWANANALSEVHTLKFRIV